MRAGLSLICGLLLFPACTFAALNAGVVSGIWFSSQSLTAGEAARIYTAVQNQSQETIEGSVAFLVDDDIVGTAPFTATPNEVLSVSVEHTFASGSHRVSAYITSVNQGTVASAIVPEVKISVAAAASTSSEEKSESSEESNAATNAIETARNAVTGTRDAITPRMEAVASRIEDFRDSLLSYGTSTPQAAPEAESESIPSNSEVTPATRAHSPRELAQASQEIFTADDTPLWRKVLGVLLSVLAFIVRLWMWILLLIVAFVFWRIIRGNRIS